MRWIGMARRRRIGPASAHRFAREYAHALGALGMLVMAAALNFALYPDALAAVINGERPLVGFIADEPSLQPEPASAALDENDVRLLAATMWAEARSEGEDGMRAVGHVIVNRVGRRFGENIETVILAPKQFSAWNIGDPNRPLAQDPERYATEGANLATWETAQAVAREVLSGQSVDPTDGALFYHTRAIRPWWSRYGEGRRVIGAHVFYRDVPDHPRRRGVRVTQVADVAPQFIDGVRLDATPAPEQEQPDAEAPAAPSE
ncbi:MAG: cell wall hydrolase [Hyphomonadaceae bacterium]